jgi:hypothetical protein
MRIKAVVLKRHHCSPQRFAPIDGHAKLTLQNLRYNGGSVMSREKNERIGTIDDLIIGKDRVLFGILQVGGFLGIGSHFVAVPYQSLQIDEAPIKIVLPGASKEALKNLPEFKYHA